MVVGVLPLSFIIILEASLWGQSYFVSCEAQSAVVAVLGAAVGALGSLAIVCTIWSSGACKTPFCAVDAAFLSTLFLLNGKLIQMLHAALGPFVLIA